MNATLVPVDGLAPYLTTLGFTGGFEVGRIGEGGSCLTFLVRGDGWRVVLRRPPRGHLLPSAHDVRREYRVMRALSDAGTAVPVPRPIAMCENRSVIGTDFYVMEAVDGVVLHDEVPAAIGAREHRQHICEEMVDTLLVLHEVDYRAIGLGRFGRPDGYASRQLARMTEQWRQTRFRDVPEIDEAGSWLTEHVPREPRRPTIVHGDYKLNNVMFTATPPPRLSAVLDWEVSTIGDPMADLGWLLYFWRDPGEDWDLDTPSVSQLPGFATRRELLDRYAQRLPVTSVDWYMALTGWKVAIILEASYKRYREGITDHPIHRRFEWVVPALARRALQAARGAL